MEACKIRAITLRTRNRHSSSTGAIRRMDLARLASNLSRPAVNCLSNNNSSSSSSNNNMETCPKAILALTTAERVINRQLAEVGVNNDRALMWLAEDFRL